MRFGGRRRYERVASQPQPAGIDGLRMARWVSGAGGDDVVAGWWHWPRRNWAQHALVMGAPGSGKSGTALRIGYSLAGEESGGLPVQVLYFDAKNDPELPGRFGGLMAAQGRRTHYFPEQPVDLWRGSWRAVRHRLMRIVPYATEGAASYYRDIARVVMEYVCTGWEQPPRSSAELFDRLVKASLEEGEEAHPLLASVEAERVEQVLMRYRGFWGAPGLVFDGGVSFEDIDTGYFRIEPEVLGEDADYALCMLFLDFVHYCKVRKPPEQLVVLVLDEFSAIAGAFEMDRLAEELRSFNVCLVFVPQSLEGMGSEDQRLRLLKSARLKVVHRYEDPEPLVALAGRRRVADFSLGLDGERSDEEDRVRWVDRWRVEPEAILGLGVGEAMVFREGAASRVAVEPAPEVVAATVPDAEPIDRVYEWRRRDEQPEVEEESEPEAPEDSAGYVVRPQAEGDAAEDEEGGEDRGSPGSQWTREA